MWRPMIGYIRDMSVIATSSSSSTLVILVILFEYQVYLHNEEQEDYKNRLFAYLLVLPISSEHKKNH